MRYPNSGFWSALRDCERVAVLDGRIYRLSVVDCGTLVLTTGALIACDPFVFLRKEATPAIQIEPGSYPVLVTLADVSEAGDGSHMREAYATLQLDASAEEVSRRIITPLDGQEQCTSNIDEDGKFYGFPVDAGTACFVDHGAVAALMPDGDWNATLFDNGTEESWFSRMDDPRHIREGLANVALPNAKRGENIVIIHSGWGDGFYPIVGGFDAGGRLVRVHIDFMVVFDDTAL